MANISKLVGDQSLTAAERVAKITLMAIRIPSGHNLLLRDAAAIELKWMRSQSSGKKTRRQRKQLRRMTADTGLTSIAEQSALFAQNDAADAAKADTIAALVKRLEKEGKAFDSAVKALDSAVKKRRVAAVEDAAADPPAVGQRDPADVAKVLQPGVAHRFHTSMTAHGVG